MEARRFSQILSKKAGLLDIPDAVAAATNILRVFKAFLAGAGPTVGSFAVIVSRGTSNAKVETSRLLGISTEKATLGLKSLTETSLVEETLVSATSRRLLTNLTGDDPSSSNGVDVSSPLYRISNFPCTTSPLSPFNDDENPLGLKKEEATDELVSRYSIAAAVSASRIQCTEVSSRTKS